MVAIVKFAQIEDFDVHLPWAKYSPNPGFFPRVRSVVRPPEVKTGRFFAQNVRKGPYFPTPKPP